MDMIDALLENHIIEFDSDGFFTDPQQWNPRVADWLAVHDGMDHLTIDQWTIISSLRDYYFKFGHAPTGRHVCQMNHMDKHCMDACFHEHYKEAWRLAGLPDPGEETKTYM
jgi:tRNA 2-thiouridine synthesizing protein E